MDVHFVICWRWCHSVFARFGVGQFDIYNRSEQRHSGGYVSLNFLSVCPSNWWAESYVTLYGFYPRIRRSLWKKTVQYEPASNRQDHNFRRWHVLQTYVYLWYNVGMGYVCMYYIYLPLLEWLGWLFNCNKQTICTALCAGEPDRSVVWYDVPLSPWWVHRGLTIKMDTSQAVLMFILSEKHGFINRQCPAYQKKSWVLLEFWRCE